MDTCINNIMYYYINIMYCQRLFLLFIGKQHCLHNLFPGNLPALNINFVFMQNFSSMVIMVLAVQHFNKIKNNNLKNMFRCFPHVMSKKHLFLVNLLFFGMFHRVGI